MTAILEVRDLVTIFHTDAGAVRAVDGVSFTVERGETLGIVGESGSGKSVTAQSIMRLLDPPARIEGGQVLFEGRDVLAMSQAELADWRGASAAMVFQDSLTGLNPVLRILPQVSEHVVAHGRMAPAVARRHGIDLLRRMGVASPERAAAAFPHQFSGGMRQRVMLAIGMANDPLHPLGKGAQDFIARIMAICIIDGFEMINVENHEGKLTIAAVRLFQHDWQMGFQIAAIIEPGECIHHSHFNGGFNIIA